MDDQVKRLVQIYREVTAVKDVGALAKNIELLPDLPALKRTDDNVLRDAGRSLMAAPPPCGFPVVQWAAATRRHELQLLSQPGSVKADLLMSLPKGASRQLRRTLEEVGQYVDSSIARVADHYSADLLAEARDRIIRRARTADFREGALTERRSKWRRPTTGATGTIPVVKADEAEALVVHLLALTWPEAQFSYSPSGYSRVFAGFHNGYHTLKEERVYVTGLSDVLDTIDDVVQDHRSGLGGRIFVRDGRALCAECRKPIAWVGAAQGEELMPPSHDVPAGHSNRHG